MRLYLFTIYFTLYGGMRAVIWTDVFQCVIMFGGVLAILIKGLVVVGGFGNVFSLCSKTGRLDWANWSPDPTVRHTVWGFLIGFSMTWFKFYGFQQASVQRYSATKTLSHAKLSVAVTLPAFYFLNLIVCFIGLVVVSYYASIGCDPMANGEIRNTNQMLPHFVVKMFSDSPGFAGLFLATLYGGALSSVSSSLSGSAANCWEDILEWKLKHWPESRKALLNRFLVVVFGFAATGIAFVASAVPGPISQITTALSSAILGPLCGMFLLGGLNRHANWKGALIGGITSIICSFWLVIGAYTMKKRYPTLPPLGIDGCIASSNLTFPNYDDTNSSSTFHFVDESPVNTTMTYFRPLTNQTIEVEYHGLEKFYSISYIWYSTLWMLVTVLVGSVASLIFRDRSTEEKVDESLLINFRQIFSFRGETNSDSASEKYSDVNYKAVEIRPEENGNKEHQLDQNL